MSKDNGKKSNISNIIFITGGTKSGKSEFAEYIAKKYKDLTYIALSKEIKKDEQWQKKILIHRQRRPKSWRIIETFDLISSISEIATPVLIDSIGGFVMECIDNRDKHWINKTCTLIDLLQKRNSITLIVGEQVGWSLVSEYKIGNIYIERMGYLQREISKISKENWLAINGRAIKIDEISLEIPT